MSVRLKLSLIIALAGFLSGFIFSAFMIHDIIHGYTESINSELKKISSNIFEVYISGKDKTGISYFDTNSYWVEIFEDDRDVPVFRTELAKNIAVALRDKKSWNETVRINGEAPLVRQSENGDAYFHIRRIFKEHNGKHYTVYAGMPVEYMRGELVEVTTGLAGGLLFAIIFYFAGSYMLTGFILKPVREINEQTRHITERNLHLRLSCRAQGKDEFNELAKTLNGLFDRLENAFIRQKRLIADVSHELKTPLSIMRLASDNIRGKMDGAETTVTSEEIQHLQGQIVRMDRLVKDILSLSALDTTFTVGSERVSLNSVVTELIEDYQLLAESGGIIIECDFETDMEVSGDREKLRRAFSNILDNAVKYSFDGGRVRVDGWREKNSVVVSVENEGCVVPPDSFGKVFEEFYRVEQSRASEYGGSGLGLAIVKRVVQLHGGEVVLETSSEGITSVKITLPAA
jgi:signal transduction histidine kinase